MTRSIRSLTPWLAAAALLSGSLARSPHGPQLCVVPADPDVCVLPYSPARVQVQTAPPVLVRPYSPVRFSQPPPPVGIVVTSPVIVSRPVVVTQQEPVVVSQPYEEPAVDDSAGGTMDDRGPGLRAARRVVVGGGFGGLMLSGGGDSSLASSYRLHVGLALRQVSVGLRLDLAPDAVRIEDSSGRGMGASYMMSGLGFGYHFNRDGLLHPVMGVSLEMHTLDPERGEAAVGFGVGGRAGLELEYPLDYGSLGIGLDLTAHRRLISADAFPSRTGTALAFGGYADYRF